MTIGLFTSLETNKVGPVIGNRITLWLIGFRTKVVVRVYRLELELRTIAIAPVLIGFCFILSLSFDARTSAGNSHLKNAL